jgi:hypothetical protein
MASRVWLPKTGGAAQPGGNPRLLNTLHDIPYPLETQDDFPGKPKETRAWRGFLAAWGGRFCGLEPAVFPA